MKNCSLFNLQRRCRKKQKCDDDGNNNDCNSKFIRKSVEVRVNTISIKLLRDAKATIYPT